MSSPKEVWRAIGKPSRFFPKDYYLESEGGLTTDRMNVIPEGGLEGDRKALQDSKYYFQ